MRNAFPKRMKNSSVAGITKMDKVDFVFAYLLSFISALALTYIPGLNHKIVYLVISTVIVFVVALMSSWIEKEMKNVGYD